MFTEEPFSRLDLAFADFLAARASVTGKSRYQVKILLATLSQQQNQGHSCILVNDPDKDLFISSGLCCSQSDSTGETYPLVIEGNRLYIQRYWFYENRLAQQINQLANISLTDEAPDSLAARYFGGRTPENEHQQLALKKAVERNLCIITGGPGTGKTTTVCKILAVLQELADEPLVIALTAPTGKAAMRLQESIANHIDQMACPEKVKQHIPRSATTVHRLLGSKPPSPYFRHHAENPLNQDVIIVDEASMVDLALMSKLVDALKPNAKLILLGDKDQLVSVESGSVLADLIAALPDNTVELTHSYRFESHIKQLADAINRQDLQSAWELLNNAGATSVLTRDNLFDYIVEKRQPYIDLVNRRAEITRIFQAYNQFQILCANRNGQFGAQGICVMIERKLFKQTTAGINAQWYPGKPVIILQNNPNLNLFNGDIGICLEDGETENALMVFFQRPDGSVRKYLPSRLPPCETALALTVHKSQGSEFNEVLIVLPTSINPVLSKELLYTAVTRAKQSVKVLADEAILAATVGRKIERHTGLALKLRPK